MTIKELVKFTGKTERTIRNWIAKAGDNLDIVPYEEISQGIPHDYSILEVENILKSGSMSKDAVKIPDERYGQVNSYPVEILEEYFSE